MPIRNPTQEEVDLITKGKVENLNQTKVDKKSNTKSTLSNPDELKPKSSRFEPDPVKFELPSGNTFVPTGYLWVRRMNTEEEGKLLDGQNKNATFTETVNTVLSSAVKSNYPVQELPLVDKLPLFVFLLSLTFENSVDVSDVVEGCGACSKEYKYEVSLTQDAFYEKIPNNEEYPFVVSLESYGEPHTVCFNYPKIKNEVKTQNIDVSKALTELAVYLKNSSGHDVPQEQWKDMFNWLSQKDKKAISEKLSKFNKYGSYVKLQTTNCTNPNCTLKEVQVKVESLFSKVLVGNV